MKLIFKPGDKKVYVTKVSTSDLASFGGVMVHPVCATFALARDFEWSSRLFVLDMKEDHEEGVGTFVTIEHKGPAFEDEEITFTATMVKIHGNELSCAITATVGQRIIAKGATGQKIMHKENLKKIFKKL
jgi:fluoroacetyl-CoA thioesterase